MAKCSFSNVLHDAKVICVEVANISLGLALGRETFEIAVKTSNFLQLRIIEKMQFNENSLSNVRKNTDIDNDGFHF